LAQGDVTRLLRRSGRRHLQVHPWQLVLAVGGVALGVALAVAVALATGSAKRAFTLTNDELLGSTTHQIVAGSEGLPDELYRQIRVELGMRNVAPVVEGYVLRDGSPPRSVRLLGIDPLAEGRFRGRFSATPNSGEFPLEDLLTVPGAALAAGGDLPASGELHVRVDGRAEVFHIVGSLGDDGSAALDGILLADIATAQETLGRQGRLTRIDIHLERDDGSLDAIREILPPGARVVDAKARADTTVQMTQAFELNLRAMSLLAMLCSLFLIYNTMTFSVVQRREQFGRLRALGVTRAEILRLVLGEAALIGLAGTLLGILGGVALGNGLVRLVTRTISDLYFAVTVQQLTVTAETIGLAVVLGVAGTLFAAFIPAREATRVSPRVALTRSVLEERTAAAAPWLAAGGVGAVVVGVGLAEWPQGGLAGAFAGLLLVVVGAALCAPLCVRLVAHVTASALGRMAGAPARMAARGLVAGLSRTAVAVAALAIAVAVVVGVGVMVTSFRTTLVNWLGHTLQADLYVAPVTAGGQVATLPMSPEQEAAIWATPGVTRTRSIRSLRIETAEEPTTLIVVEHDQPDREAYRLREPVEGAAVDAAWRDFAAGAVLISEPYAERRGVAAGEQLVLPTPAGEQTFAVAGVYFSYASDRGAVMLARDVYDRYWDDPGISGLSVYLQAPERVQEVSDAIREVLAPQAVTVVSNRDLRRQSMEVFDRTFQITGVLRTLVTLVAFVGVLGAILAFQLERSREHGVLRVTGFTPGQLGQTVVWQSALMGATAGLMALPLGWLLAWLMIHVINKRSFGWTLQMTVPSDVLIQAFAVAVAAAIVAGLYPALRIARTPPIVIMRED